MELLPGQKCDVYRRFPFKGIDLGVFILAKFEHKFLYERLFFCNHPTTFCDY